MNIGQLKSLNAQVRIIEARIAKLRSDLLINKGHRAQADNFLALSEANSQLAKINRLVGDFNTGRRTALETHVNRWGGL